MSKLLMIKLSEIEVLDQPRKDFSGVDMIAESIQKVGLLNPLVVRSNGSGKYILVDGEQRFRALVKLKQEQAPAHVTDISEEQAHKESQMMANLARTDLSLIEKARGFLMLLTNAPAKYNEKTISNKFGVKVSDVKKLVSVARKIDGKLDGELVTGMFDFEDLETLSRVPSEYQDAVVKHAVKRCGNLRNTIYETTEPLHFDDTFKMEQARSAGKLHYKESWGSRDEGWRTFDKKYAAEVTKEFEERRKESADEARKKAQTKAETKTVQTVEQKKKEREKKAKDLKQVFETMAKVLPAFIKNKTTKSEKAMQTVYDRYLSELGLDDCKLLLRAFGVQFKASEIGSNEIRQLVSKNIFKNLITDERTLLHFIEAVQLFREQVSSINDLSGWKGVIKKLS